MALNETSPVTQLQGVTCHMASPATRHKWTHPTFTPSSKLVLDLPTAEGWKAELTEATWQCTGRESNLQSFDHESEVLTTIPLRHHSGCSIHSCSSSASDFGSSSRSRRRGGCGSGTSAAGIVAVIIGIGDEGGHVSPPPPKKMGKIFWGQLLCKIWAFFGQNYVKFGNSVNFPSTYDKNSSILVILQPGICKIRAFC